MSESNLFTIKTTKDTVKVTLRGKGEVEKGFVYMEWIRKIREANNIDEAIKTVEEIYMCGYSDSTEMHSDGLGWDK